MNAIEKRQNENRMLRYQYTARCYYNRAEKLNELVWICCVISWLTIFFPVSFTQRIFPICMSFFMDIIAAVLNWRMTSNVFWASSLRKYFDAYVLNLNMNQFSEPSIRKFEELSLNTVKRYPQKSKEQMSNTGRDIPPGVKDWYELSPLVPEQDAVFECQKQNCWWNKKITRVRIIRAVIGLLVLIPLIIFLFIEIKVGILLTILSSGGLIIKCATRLVANVRYYVLSIKIDGVLNVLASSRSNKNIEILQANIDERRAMPVLERSHTHKRHAKEYSELYQNTSIYK